MYSPYLGIFTSRDPVAGNYQEPITLHKYLYCGNEPINRYDQTGLVYYNLDDTQAIIDTATLLVGTNIVVGPWLAHGPGGIYDFGHSFFKKYHNYDTFTISSWERPLNSGQFGNYLAGYTTYYNYGSFGETCARMVGTGAATHDIGQVGAERAFAEEISSQFWITKGALDANIRLSKSVFFNIGSFLNGDVHNSFTNALDRYRLKMFVEVFQTMAAMTDYNLWSDR